jgi:CDP-glucose 4,6-dehydratase
VTEGLSGQTTQRAVPGRHRGAADLERAFSGRSVLLTGHTGFKGSWLALWLHRLGANVTGLALEPPTSPNHFQAARVGELLVEDVRGDIRDTALVAEVVERCRPDVVFHLAAQPIVRASLVAPLETFAINVLGTASLLDAVRAAGRPCAVVAVTSDKCYRNEGQVWGFREVDPLGGHDPYSASKAGSELVVDAYRSSYFPSDRIDEHGIRLASVRAGNVIGGGDWADDRIVPDAVRALAGGEELVVRNPASTRPWQHVLEPLSGYLALAERMVTDDGSGLWNAAWNFGPLTTDEATVADLATAVVESWGEGRWVPAPRTAGDVEARTLRIAIDKAATLLQWAPRWRFSETVDRTVQWYRAYYAEEGRSMRDRSLLDIEAYEGAG